MRWEYLVLAAALVVLAVFVFLAAPGILFRPLFRGGPLMHPDWHPH